jgi:flagellar hook assembly protein FlgD
MAVSSASLGVTGTQGAQTPDGYDAFSKVDMNDFIKLMIAELQNQDPMNPMDNTQMLEQISQIREIGSNDRLSQTLDAVLLGQNISTANNMIGQTITALDDDAKTFVGTVERVAIEDGVPKLRATEHIPEHLDEETGRLVAEQTVEHTVSLKNISQVLPDSEDTALLAQKLSAAGSLVGQTIIGVTDSSEVVTGPVSQVSLEDGAVKLTVGGKVIDLENVTHVVDGGTGA